VGGGGGGGHGVRYSINGETLVRAQE